MLGQMLKSLQVKDIMATRLVTLNQLDDFALVKEKMDMYDIRHLPVVDEWGKLVGLITQRDLYKIHSPRRLEDGSWFYDTDTLNGFILAKVMLTSVITIPPDASLYQAISVMVVRKVGSLVVVDPQYKPIGMVTRVDILKFLLTQ